MKWKTCHVHYDYGYAARLVLKTRKWDPMMPLLNELHWLPVKFRCQYKIATFAYHHFDGTLPSDLSASLHSAQNIYIKHHKPSNPQVRSFWKSQSAIWNLLLHEHSFSFIAPSVWNLLPASLRNLPTLSDFKAELKTYLYGQAFTQI